MTRSTVSAELAKVQSLTESNKMCQTEYEITPKKKSSNVKASKVNHVSNTRKAAPKTKNKPLQSYEHQKTGGKFRQTCFYHSSKKLG